MTTEHAGRTASETARPTDPRSDFTRPIIRSRDTREGHLGPRVPLERGADPARPNLLYQRTLDRSRFLFSIRLPRLSALLFLMTDSETIVGAAAGSITPRTPVSANFAHPRLWIAGGGTQALSGVESSDRSQPTQRPRRLSSPQIYEAGFRIRQFRSNNSQTRAGNHRFGIVDWPRRF
jgi:hypothetical protein